MDKHQFVSVSRTLIKRGLTDIERKVAAYCASGAAGVLALDILQSYGVTLPETAAAAIPWLIGALGGYFVHSVGSVTTFSNDRGTEVATVTAPVRVIKNASPVEKAVSQVEANFPVASSEESTNPTVVAPSFTQVLKDDAPMSQAASFLAARAAINNTGDHTVTPAVSVTTGDNH